MSTTGSQLDLLTLSGDAEGLLREEDLGDGRHVLIGRLPAELCPGDEELEALWESHPEEYHELTMHGRVVKTPRWQQAYGADYRYTGQVNEARPLTPPLRALLEWFCEEIDARLNGLLLNWYDGSLGHYIGAHRDSTQGLIEGAPIVTLSLGEERVFRLRPWKGKGWRDFTVGHGALLVIPWETNAAWTHEVPKFKRHQGRRISITARAFEVTRHS